MLKSIYGEFEKKLKKKYSQKEAFENLENYSTDENVVKKLIENKIVKDEKTYLKDLHDFLIDFTKFKLKREYSPDKIVVQLVQGLEDSEKITNLMYERVSEIFSTYDPEKEKEFTNMKQMSEYIVKNVKQGKNKNKMGWDLNKDEILILRKFSLELLNYIKFKEELEKYIEKIMKKFAPNLTIVAGPILGARLINSAGSLERLSKFPSSTIQVLGAEKALFRHLRSGAKPPKHGLVLQHPLVLAAGKNKGRVARMLASKIMIACRTDYFSKGKKIIGEKLLEDLKNKVKK